MDVTVSTHFRSYHGILVILIGSLCLLLPLFLLLFYPKKWFQKYLNVLKLNRYGLQKFFDSFAGCYKDGTEPGTRDCCYFAALFLLLRILTYLVLSAFPITCAIAINGIIIMLFMAFFVACQPYKAKFAVYNWITGLMLALMAAMNMALLGALMSQIKTLNYMQFSFLVLIVLMLIPQLYTSLLSLLDGCSTLFTHISQKGGHLHSVTNSNIMGTEITINFIIDMSVHIINQREHMQTPGSTHVFLIETVNIFCMGTTYSISYHFVHNEKYILEWTIAYLKLITQCSYSV